MVNLTEEMKETFRKNTLFPVATASKAGVPNVAPIGFVQLVSDDTFWLADNFMNKTMANIRENPIIAIYAWDPDAKRCFQVKGRVEVKTSGPDYEKMREMVHAKRPTLPARSLLVMKVTDVYTCVAGPDAGKKVL